MASGSEINLCLRPQSRLDLIDVTGAIVERFGDILSPFRKSIYYSFHTTAGYLDQRLCSRLNHDPESLRAFVRSFQGIFPPNADYLHDQLHLREELSEEQRQEEPRNADAHLTFIGSGLRSLVTYPNSPKVPVYFIDLDGTNGAKKRLRHTKVIGFDSESLVTEKRILVPVSNHAIDSVSLKDRHLGVFGELSDLVRRHDVHQGRIQVSLSQDEQGAGLTVNEYETLLMTHDLMEVLQSPVRFMAERGRHILQNPGLIASKAKGYAKYDLVQVLNEFLDAAGLSESLLEKIIHKFMAVPASRFLRMKRSIDLLVCASGEHGAGRIVEGTYQSPILVQWNKAQAQTRRLKVTLHRFS